MSTSVGLELQPYATTLKKHETKLDTGSEAPSLWPSDLPMFMLKPRWRQISNEGAL